MSKIVNAKIDGKYLGFEDHNILTCTLNFNLGAYHQGIPCYNFSNINALDRFLVKLFDVLEVTSWEEINNQYCRVIIGDNALIRGMMHITNDSREFTFKDCF